MYNTKAVLAKAEELNEMAAKLLPMPDGLTQPEQQLFICLRFLYREYKAGVIKLEQAKAEKNKIISAYKQNAFNFEVYQVQAKRHKAFSANYQEIKNSGCAVCQKLDRILVGLE